MARSPIVAAPMTDDEACSLFRQWLTAQRADGRQGERLLSVNLGAGGVICSMKAMVEMARYERLTMKAATRSENA